MISSKRKRTVVFRVWFDGIHWLEAHFASGFFSRLASHSVDSIPIGRIACRGRRFIVNEMRN